MTADQPTPAEVAPDRGRPAPSARDAARITAWLAIIHALLVLVSIGLVQSVPRGDPEALRAFYASGDSRRVVLAGLYLLPFAGIAFVWFEVALRAWISLTHRRIDVILSNVQLVSGIVFITLFFAAVATSASMTAAVEWAGVGVDMGIARFLPAYGDTLIYVFAIKMAAMFIFTTTTIGRSSSVLPRWFIGLGYVLGIVLLLSPVFSAPLVVAFPVWLLVLGAILLRRARTLPAHLTMDELGSRVR
jgi:hypothetical protein